jgi:hypothetical protein
MGSRRRAATRDRARSCALGRAARDVHRVASRAERDRTAVLGAVVLAAVSACLLAIARTGRAPGSFRIRERGLPGRGARLRAHGRNRHRPYRWTAAWRRLRSAGVVLGRRLDVRDDRSDGGQLSHPAADNHLHPQDRRGQAELRSRRAQLPHTQRLGVLGVFSSRDVVGLRRHHRAVQARHARGFRLELGRTKAGGHSAGPLHCAHRFALSHAVAADRRGSGAVQGYAAPFNQWYGLAGHPPRPRLRAIQRSRCRDLRQERLRAGQPEPDRAIGHGAAGLLQHAAQQRAPGGGAACGLGVCAIRLRRAARGAGSAADPIVSSALRQWRPGGLRVERAMRSRAGLSGALHGSPRRGQSRARQSAGQRRSGGHCDGSGGAGYAQLQSVARRAPSPRWSTSARFTWRAVST